MNYKTIDCTRSKKSTQLTPTTFLGESGVLSLATAFMPLDKLMFAIGFSPKSL